MISRGQALLVLHLAVLLFGASGLIGKEVATPALTVTCLRSLVASAVLWALVGLNRQVPIRALWGRSGLVIAGGLVLALHWWTFFESIQRSTVALGLLTFASFPLFACLLGWIVLGEPLRRSDMLACCLILAGLALVIPGWRVGAPSGTAAAFGIASGFTFALLTSINRRLAPVLPALGLVSAQTGVAGLCLLPWAAADFSGITHRDWLLLAMLGVLFTGLAHGCFTASLAQVRVATAGVSAALEPVYGIVLAWIILGEQPSVRMLAGGVLIVLAAILGARKAPAQLRALGDTPPLRVAK